MQRLHWGRMAAVVGIFCVVGGAANGDALADIVMRRNANDFTGINGQMRLSLPLLGVLDANQLPLDSGTFRDNRDGSEHKPAGRRTDGWSRHGVRAFTRGASDGTALVLNGADTSVKTFDWETGRHVRNAVVTTYSDVRFAPRGASHAWPTSGVAYMAMESAVKDTVPLHNYFSSILYFDGTRTPEIYIDGKRYTVDLTTGIATPKPIG